MIKKINLGKNDTIQSVEMVLKILRNIKYFLCKREFVTFKFVYNSVDMLHHPCFVCYTDIAVSWRSHVLSWEKSPPVICHRPKVIFHVSPVEISGGIRRGVEKGGGRGGGG
jgi:hypothetical protein